MECNRDEANRAKEIAENKFTAKDIIGAKKFAAKAQSLYPDLEGIQQMIATFDVYISAENKIKGEADWYGILGAKPLSDEETVRKQYRKLALMLHPDKNKSIGAEGAFKFISEAWSLLSDKTKKLAYDQKRNASVSRHTVSPSTGSPSAPPGSNGFYNFAPNTAQNKTVQKGNKTKSGASTFPSSSHKPKPNTFWTVCHRCKMQYEYLRTYLNQNLLCPNCHDPFFAIETSPPYSNGSKGLNQANHSRQRQNSNNSQWGPFSGTTGASSSAQAATMVQQAYEKVKREREVAEAARKREEALRRKRARRTSGVSSSVAVKKRRGVEDLGAMKNGRDSVKQGPNKPRSLWDLSHLEIQSLLMDKAKMEIRKNLRERNSVKNKEDDIEKVKGAMVTDNPTSGASQDQFNNSEPVKLKDDRANNFSSGTFDGDVDKELLKIMSINVPESDFQNFDKDRTEYFFGKNQVWAAYDNDDGMPRNYAMIHEVISLNPFKMRISWLISKTSHELGAFNWICSGFSITCGEFKIGKHEINSSINSFSHKVKWIGGAHGAVSIFPRKGDVWALYRNWSRDWNELTEYEVVHKYDVVEVLEDYDEELGVIVIPLVKVAGFKTVFHRHLDPMAVTMIPKTEMFRFSHQVPSHLLNGQEAPKGPMGCRELDPAATPLELVHVITAVEEQKVLGNDQNTETEKVADGLGKSKNIGMEENSNLSIEKMEEKTSRSCKEISGTGRESMEIEILKDGRESMGDMEAHSIEDKMADSCSL